MNQLAYTQARRQMSTVGAITGMPDQIVYFCPQCMEAEQPECRVIVVLSTYRDEDSAGMMGWEYCVEYVVAPCGHNQGTTPADLAEEATRQEFYGARDTYETIAEVIW